MFSRRDILKFIAVGGSASLLPFSYNKYLKRFGINQAFADGGVQSPPLTPFLDPLPLPSEIEPVKPFDAPDWEEFIGETTRFYKIVAEERYVQFHSQLPQPTSIWGYRPNNVPHGEWNFALGPTLIANASQHIKDGMIVQHLNNLPIEHQGFGHPELSVHLHGGHHPSRSDGFPGNIDGFQPFTFGPGEHYTYSYPMAAPGLMDGAAEYSEIPSTLWYHDHAEDFTAANVYKGLAGFHLVYEDATTDGALDIGDESSPRGLHLPSGDYDIPIFLQDKTFLDDGSLFYNPFDHDGFLGDTYVINGKVQPYFNVKRRKYRFRLLNGSNARFYHVSLTNENGREQPFDMIATDGGLLSRTLRDKTSFLIAMAERFEIVVDFSKYNTGDVLYFEDRLEQDDGRGPKGKFDSPKLRNLGTRFLKFIVGEEAVDMSEVPDMLRPFEPISDNVLAQATVKTFEFERRHGAWQINHQFFDRNQALAESHLGEPEIWRLVNKSGGWWHPIHIHSEFGRVIRRNGKLPPLHERDGIAKKDTFILGPNDEVEIFLKFRDFTGPFVFHCHTLEHEDMFMMGRFDVV